MHFAEPNWLWAGALGVLGLCLLVAWSERRRTLALARFVAMRHLAGLTSSLSKPRRWIKHTLAVLSVGCLFLTLARPQWGHHFEAQKREGVDVLFAVDSSKSMLAEDLRPSRLVRAKLAVEELVDKLPGARLGLVAFAGDAFLQTPLTADRVAFQRSLDALDTSAIPIPGTNLQSAIRVAEQALRTEPGQRKVVVLLTDGEDLSDSVQHAARMAADSGIVVHAIGVGTSAGATIPIDGGKSGDALLRDLDGQLVHSRLDEGALRELSAATGGSYHALGASGQGTGQLFDEALSKLPKQLRDVEMRKVFHERFQWPLGLAMVFMVLWLLLNEQSTRRGRGRADGAPVAAAISGALVCGLLVMSSAAAAQDRSTVSTYNDATQSYRGGDFKAAAQGYRAALETRDVKLQQRAYYDLGNSLYRQGQAREAEAAPQAMEQYKQAISAYESALALDANDEDARYNLDFVRAKLKELEQRAQSDKGDSKEPSDGQQANSGSAAEGGEGKQGEQDQSSDGAGSDSASQQSSGGDQRNSEAPGDSGSGSEREQADGKPPGQEQRGGSGEERDPRAQADGKSSGQEQREGSGEERDPHAQADGKSPGGQDQRAAAAQEAQGQRQDHAAAAEGKPNRDPSSDEPQAPGQAANVSATPSEGTGAATSDTPSEAAVAGGLTREQAARLLDALDGELQQLPSGHAATNQEDQTRKDW